MVAYNIIMAGFMGLICMMFAIITSVHITDCYDVCDFVKSSDLKEIYLGTKILIGISICSFVLTCIHIFLACIL